MYSHEQFLQIAIYKEEELAIYYAILRLIVDVHELACMQTPIRINILTNHCQSLFTNLKSSNTTTMTVK